MSETGSRDDKELSI